MLQIRQVDGAVDRPAAYGAGVCHPTRTVSDPRCRLERWLPPVRVGPAARRGTQEPSPSALGHQPAADGADRKAGPSLAAAASRAGSLPGVDGHYREQRGAGWMWDPAL